MKNHAFTLAEVLITLTIIGVIAALTIPNLINKWQNHAMAVKFQKAYTILGQAISQAKVETGLGDYTCTNDADKTEFAKNIISHLKAKKICSDAVWSSSGKECGNNQEYPANKTLPRTYLNGEPAKTIGGYGFEQYSIKFILEDGMSIYIMKSSGSGFVLWNLFQGTELGTAVDLLFIIDVNGVEAPPNRIGRDIYFAGFSDNEYGAQPVNKRINGLAPIGIGPIEDDCIPGGKGLTCAKKIIVDKILDY